MNILRELTLSHVELPGFRSLMETVQPNFKAISRATVKAKMLTQLQKMTAVIMADIAASNSRISFTSDIWTSNQNINYMAVAAQWITSGYKFNKKIISFRNLTGGHTGKDISTDFLGVVASTSKMMTLALDNASSNKVAVGHIIQHLQVEIKIKVHCTHLEFDSR
ncbi:unnamed protein product [Albugo candida]|uniref:HAT C-terminal dimerisation domain-containing protein n=1 Tax=Albugo candida TaxID=65357 RepID=A0A024FTJ5_9STRA|nr:unnamed protein product [Albugo candida]|eukprot:CCI10351.1 unnamed protein product [Albugo candida]